MKQSKGMLQNAMILFTAAAITKIIGAILKIPLGNILGGLGMGYFSAAYSVFTPVFSLTTAAIPTVITKLVAQNLALGKFHNVRKIKTVSLKLSALLGFFGMITILVITAPFALYVADSPKSIPAMLCIAPALFFCCIAAVYRGYFEGFNNMLPTALSQVVEAVVKAALGISLAFIVLQSTASLPYAAAASIVGVTISEFIGLAFIALRSKTLNDGLTENEMINSPLPEKSIVIVKKIYKEMLPITIGALVINLNSFIDLLTINNCINLAINRNKEFFLQNFVYGLQGGVELTELGDFIYGSYTGIVTSLFAIIPSMTGMVNKSTLPSIAAAWECGNKKALIRNIKISFKGMFVMGLPLCFGMAILSQPLLGTLYSSKPAEVSVCIEPLFVLSAGGIVFSITNALFSIFQAIGKSDLIIKLMLLCSVVKLAGNLVLVQIPELNITGAALATIFSYLVVNAAGLVILKRIVKEKTGIAGYFFKSLINAAVCAISAYAVYKYIPGFDGNISRLLFAIIFAAAIYGIMVLLTDKNSVKVIISRK